MRPNNRCTEQVHSNFTARDSGFLFAPIGSHAVLDIINFGQGYFGTTAVASAGTAPSEGGIFEYDCPMATKHYVRKVLTVFN